MIMCEYELKSCDNRFLKCECKGWYMVLFGIFLIGKINLMYVKGYCFIGVNVFVVFIIKKILDDIMYYFLYLYFGNLLLWFFNLCLYIIIIWILYV